MLPESPQFSVFTLHISELEESVIWTLSLCRCCEDTARPVLELSLRDTLLLQQDPASDVRYGVLCSVADADSKDTGRPVLKRPLGDKLLVQQDPTSDVRYDVAFPVADTGCWSLDVDAYFFWRTILFCCCKFLRIIYGAPKNYGIFSLH